MCGGKVESHEENIGSNKTLNLELNIESYGNNSKEKQNHNFRA